MLCQINIQDFAIVKKLELSFSQGMSCITGETGAGKSIILDALGLCLGGRAESTMIRSTCPQADISACFDITQREPAVLWLKKYDLYENNECIIRRVITKEGRSRSYINGKPTSLSQLKQLGELLIQIHGQHAHHALLQKENQMLMLDQYAIHSELVYDVESAYGSWKALDQEQQQLQREHEAHVAQKQLLAYQIDELCTFEPLENEYLELEKEHKILAHGHEIIDGCQQELERLAHNDTGALQHELARSCSTIEQLCDLNSKLVPIHDMLSSALIHIEESVTELTHFVDTTVLDPERLNYIEQRLSTYHDLARKHQTKPNEIFQYHLDLQETYKQLEQQSERLDNLQQLKEESRALYQSTAQALSESRINAAKKLSSDVELYMKQLNMEQARFHIDISELPGKFSKLGYNDVDFLMSTNSGQELAPIKKVASGGELSRIGLTLQVLTSHQKSTPTLIFDEVDVGISGATAAIVGELLQNLSQNNQVFCITHLPQVAGYAHQHLFVKKETEQGETVSSIMQLSTKQRLEEMARLLTGSKITGAALENAKQLLVAEL